MTIAILICLMLIILLLIGVTVMGLLMWQKLSTYLTWNTRYQTADYEKTIATPKMPKPFHKPTKTVERGRSIKPVDDLVDLGDLDIDTAMNAIEEAGNG